jgi:hypothetical protein
METTEEAKIWEALQLLTKAEYAIGQIASKTIDMQVLSAFEKAKEKIKEAEVLITPLRNL